jgi:hypothetical protein
MMRSLIMLIMIISKSNGGACNMYEGDEKYIPNLEREA